IMRMLWVSLLLVGSVSCAPQQGASGGGPPMWMYPASPSGQAPSPPAYEKPVGQASGYVGYRPGLHCSSNTNTVGGVSGSPHLVQQVVPQVGQYGAPGCCSSVPYQQTEGSWSSSSDTGGEDEPVFTPVEDEDQVYAFKSRSNYHRKRLLLHQIHYTPTQVYIDEPQHHHHGKGHHHKDQVKGD
uniref:Secreted protein n=1 Tax=Nothobranchius furzeri TaxID=105023 RepID=A0A8C6PZB8_NOTFU